MLGLVLVLVLGLGLGLGLVETHLTLGRSRLDVVFKEHLIMRCSYFIYLSRKQKEWVAHNLVEDS